VTRPAPPAPPAPDPNGWPAGAAGQRPRPDSPPPPGQMAVVMAALSIGLLLMRVQLWLLTVALDLYLAGEGPRTWSLALASGAIFLGGLLMLVVLRRRPAGPPVVVAPPEPPLPARLGAAPQPAAGGRRR